VRGRIGGQPLDLVHRPLRIEPSEAVAHRADATTAGRSSAYGSS
jgi:hypothetical protein